MSLDRPPTLPRKLEQELRRAAKPGRADDAVKWMVQYERAHAAGRTIAARRAAARAKEFAPRATAVREALGLAAFAAGDHKEAIQELLALRRLTGNHAHDPVIAECYRLLGRPDRALEFLADLDASAGPRIVLESVIVRARAMADGGRAREGIALLVHASRRAGPTVRARLTKEADDIRAHQEGEA